MTDIIERLKNLDTASVSDAMDSLGLEGGLLGIIPIVGGKKICGKAFTVHYVPCSPGSKGTVGDFLDDVEPGQVVVIDNAGRNYCTVWGDIMAYTAKYKGVEGTVIDGVCRDIPLIRSIDYPMFSKGAYMVTGKERVEVDSVNIPVSISGVNVRPDDIILGDDSGVIRIPAEHAIQVATKAEEIELTEKKIIDEVKKGSSLREAREKLKYHFLQSRHFS